MADFQFAIGLRRTHGEEKHVHGTHRPGPAAWDSFGVLVVGDLMLDRYVWGDAERISQEAPVILLRADQREERLGGASSVAAMLRSLGARVAIAGIVGNDHDGGRVRQILTDLGIDHDAVLTDIHRPTTVKERYIGRANIAIRNR